MPSVFVRTDMTLNDALDSVVVGVGVGGTKPWCCLWLVGITPILDGGASTSQLGFERGSRDFSAMAIKSTFDRSPKFFCPSYTRKSTFFEFKCRLAIFADNRDKVKH